MSRPGPTDVQTDHSPTIRPVLLSVCAGNQCRSPLMAALLGAALPELDCRSAGTQVSQPSPCPPETLRAASVLGIDLDDHRAQALDAHDLSGAELVLTADRAQRRAVAALRPRLVRATFTLREFSRLSTHVSPRELRAAVHPLVGPRERLSLAVALAAAQRGKHGIVPPDEDDVPDPIGRGRAAAIESASLVADAVATVVGYLREPAAP